MLAALASALVHNLIDVAVNRPFQQTFRNFCILEVALAPTGPCSTAVNITPLQRSTLAERAEQRRGTGRRPGPRNRRRRMWLDTMVRHVRLQMAGNGERG